MATPQIWQTIQGWAERSPEVIAIEAPGIRIPYAELVDRAFARSRTLKSDERVVIVPADREGRAVVEVLAAQELGIPALLLPRDIGADYERSVRKDVVKLLTGRGSGLSVREVLGRGGIWTTTSGTTGRPKIVAHDPSGIDRFVVWSLAEFGFSAADTSLSLAPMNFDVSLFDVWAVLTAGGRIAFASESHLTDGPVLARSLVEYRVTIVQAVPVVFELLLRSLQPTQAVRLALSTGDVLRPATRQELNEAFPLARTLSVYGSTETNDSFLLDLRADGTGSLGTAIAGVNYRLDAKPGGDIELVVSTPFQALGYVNAPNDAWSEGEHGREFRTGDLVTVRDDRLYLEGRHDRQVKIRGVRVSLADVEEVLRSQPGVVDAIAVAAPDSRGDLRISALVRYDEVRPKLLDLRRAAAASLPTAAVPSRVHLVDHPFPLTATGKIDRRGAISQLERQPA